jgi:hypothetical protein
MPPSHPPGDAPRADHVQDADALRIRRCHFLEETMTKKLTKLKPLSWKPARHGDTFCAPACGHGCTYQEYERAQISAKTLCENLGPGWKPKVWENMGWHFQAISSCGRLEVHTNGLLSRSFCAFIGESGSSEGRWVGHGSTPKAAVTAVKSKARAELDYIAGLLDGLPGGKR